MSILYTHELRDFNFVRLIAFVSASDKEIPQLSDARNLFR